MVLARPAADRQVACRHRRRSSPFRHGT